MAEQHRPISDLENDSSKQLSGSIYLRTNNTGPIERPSRRHLRCSDKFVRYLCAFFISFLFVVAVVIFVAWISVRPHKPRVVLDYAAISYFHVSNVSLDATMNFNVSFRNSNEKVVIFYDNFFVEVIYSSERIASGSVPKFVQGEKNTTVIQPRAQAHLLRLDPQTSAELAADNQAGRIGFDLKMTAKTRFKLGRWSTKHYRMTVKCVKLVINFIPGPFHRQKCRVFF